METAHLHLIANHVPVFALIFSLILMVAGEILKNKTLLVTAFSGFIIAAIASVIAFMTGEEAEHVVENIIQADLFIEQHEDLAKPANISAVVLGVLSLSAIIFEFLKNYVPVALKRIILLISFVAVVLMSYTAYLGGQIRHTEVRDANLTTLPLNQNEEVHDDD